MNKKVKKILCSALATVMAAGAIGLVACSSDKHAYSVKYDLNYDGADVRTVSVLKGATAVEWQPYREGWSIEGWYTDANCTEAYDFSAKVEGDVQLYAYWSKSIDTHRVVFDSNYAGGGSVYAEAGNGKRLDRSAAPAPERLGHKFTGWYKDADCTDEWVFESDAVTKPTTLYAGYKYDDSVPRNADGTPVFENVNINVWRSIEFYTKSVIEDITDQFNKEYAGKISVNLTNSLFNQDAFSLRFQQTPGRNTSNNSYYSMSDIYALAGLDFSPLLWYEGGSRDSYVDGKLCSIPLFASAPYLIYNKELMTKYNGNAELPAARTQFSELLKKVYDGERSDISFRTIVSDGGWTYAEMPSAAPFLQNGLPYYDYDNGAYYTDWTQDDKFEQAVDALEVMYDYFGAGGSIHGEVLHTVADQDGATVISRVRNKEAFMGIVNWACSSMSLVNADDIGVLPLAGLYSDDPECKDLTPVHTMGLSCYKAASVDNTELAACAVFADYVSKNSWRFVEKGYYPLRRSAAESKEFLNNENGYIAAMSEFVRSTVDPENFTTFYGSLGGKAIVNSDAALAFFKPFLQEPDNTNASYVIDKLRYMIIRRLVV